MKNDISDHNLSLRRRRLCWRDTSLESSILNLSGLKPIKEDTELDLLNLLGRQLWQ